MLTIGKIAKASGCNVRAIRYYEQIGLIGAAQRSQGNQRLYSHTDVDKLQFIRHARSLGFSIDTIKNLLLLENNKEMPCEVIDNIAKEHLGVVHAKITQLESLAQELRTMLSCGSNQTIMDCNVLKSLHNHERCDVHQVLNL